MARPLASVWVVLALALALWALGAHGELLRASHWAHHVYLADAFLHGQAHLLHRPNDAGDMALVGERLYIVFGPFPALLLMPLVPFFARGTPDVLVLVLTSLAALFAFHRLLERVVEPRDRLRVALATLTLGFGTAMHYGAVMGNVWLHTQITAVALQVMALLLAARGRAWTTGALLGLTVLTRPTLTLAAPLAAWWLAHPDNLPGRAAVPWRRTLIALGVPIAIAAAVHGVYNFVRFGNPADAGYHYILMGEPFETLVSNFGRFHPHFLVTNLRGWLVGLPLFSQGRITPDAHGMSLLLTTPFLLFALWPRRVESDERVAMGSIVIIALPSLLYYNDGWVQFGQRFALDWLALGLFVAARGAKRAPLAMVAGLTLWGMVVGAWGLQWFRANFLH
ncbi:MAG: hypothetical protein ABIU54_03220 [Candidatus Eisenbacteria bacterium]